MQLKYSNYVAFSHDHGFAVNNSGQYIIMWTSVIINSQKGESMYLDFQVKIPTESAGITRKKIKGITYIYYAYEHNYNTEKGYTVPKNTTIGKCTDDD